MTPVEVAVIQVCATGDHERSMAEVVDASCRALDSGAELVLLPENYAGMAPNKDGWAFDAEDPLASSALAPLAELTRIKDGIILAGGTPERASGGRYFNSAVVLARGQMLGAYRKIHRFDADLPGQAPLRESERIDGGQGTVLVRTSQYNLGLSICYDLRFPELYRGLARAGAELLAVPAAFTVPTGAAHWEVLLRARAIENLAYVLAPAQYGDHGHGRRSWGHAMIVDPWGRVVAQASDGPALLRARLDPEVLLEARRRLPALSHRVEDDALKVHTLRV